MTIKRRLGTASRKNLYFRLTEYSLPKSWTRGPPVEKRCYIYYLQDLSATANGARMVNNRKDVLQSSIWIHEEKCSVLFFLKCPDLCLVLVKKLQHPVTANMRVGTLIVATIYLQLIQNRYMFRSFTVLQRSHQHCVQPVASDVKVVGYL